MSFPLFCLCFLFFCLLVCFFDTTRVYCAGNKVLHGRNYGENFALNSHINRGATNIFFHALHSSRKRAFDLLGDRRI